MEKAVYRIKILFTYYFILVKNRQIFSVGSFFENYKKKSYAHKLTKRSDSMHKKTSRRNLQEVFILIKFNTF